MSNMLEFKKERERVQRCNECDDDEVRRVDTCQRRSTSRVEQPGHQFMFMFRHLNQILCFIVVEIPISQFAGGFVSAN